jgi:hypothetical protein
MKTYTLHSYDESLQLNEASRSSEQVNRSVLQNLSIIAFSLVLAITAMVIHNAATVETHPTHFLARVTH